MYIYIYYYTIYTNSSRFENRLYTRAALIKRPEAREKALIFIPILRGRRFIFYTHKHIVYTYFSSAFFFKLTFRRAAAAAAEQRLIAQ